MKAHLFYSFLAIFIVTSIVTLLGMTNIVVVREGYLTALISAFLIELAGAVIAIFKRANFFHDEPMKPEPGASGSPIAQGPFDKEKIAQIFWLGADLHSLIWHLNVTADISKIRFYLKQANSHMKLSGLKGHPLQELMGQLYHQGRTKSAADWTPAVRHQYAQAIANLLTKIVALIEHQQGASFVGEVPDDP